MIHSKIYQCPRCACDTFEIIKPHICPSEGVIQGYRYACVWCGFYFDGEIQFDTDSIRAYGVQKKEIGIQPMQMIMRFLFVPRALLHSTPSTTRRK